MDSVRAKKRGTYYPEIDTVYCMYIYTIGRVYYGLSIGAVYLNDIHFFVNKTIWRFPFLTFRFVIYMIAYIIQFHMSLIGL